MITVSDVVKSITSTHVWLYDNGNILAEIANDGQTKYRLLSPRSVSTTTYLHISFEIYENKYRITIDIDSKTQKTLYSLISEENGRTYIKGTWKNIGIRDDILFVEGQSGIGALYSFSRDWILLGAKHNVFNLDYVSNDIYKFKIRFADGRVSDGYYFFNTKLNFSSFRKNTEGYKDIKPLSSRMVIGWNSNEDMDFLLTTSHPVKTVATTYHQAPVIDKVNRSIKIYGYYGDDKEPREFYIDFDGVLIKDDH